MQTIPNPLSSLLSGLGLGALAIGLGAPAAAGQDDLAFLQEQVFGTARWRSVGPANFGGRVVDIAVDPQRRSTFYVATGTGGLYKTVNNGTTFRSVFDPRSTFSIGDVAIAPSNPDVLYVGTGEANNQRSSYWGDGVYKSADGGRTWKHTGLRGTDHIGRIAVHPTDPDIVFVAALGALYRANDDRGLYRTKDGGATWDKVASVSDEVGFVDVVINPADPDEVYAASYERRRRAWNFDEAGAGSAIYKSRNGGDTFRKLRGGLPTGEIGRIGLTIHPQNPQILYAIVENSNPVPAGRAERPARGDDQPRTGQPRADQPRADQPRADQPRDGQPRAGRPRQAGTGPDDDASDLYPFGGTAQDAARRAPRRSKIGGEVYRTEDGGANWTRTSDGNVGGAPHYYYGQIRVDPNDDARVYVLGVRVASSQDGGKTWDTDFGNRLHVDHHALWIDPADSRHALLGNDGGLAQTWDGGQSWDYMNDLPIGQFYAVAVDDREPYNVFGGTQDNGSWGIPSRSATSQPLTKSDAFKVGGGDGFYVCVDPSDPDTIYSESQFGAISRLDLATGARKGIRPRKPKGSPRLRFNWMAPILISPHNPHTVYFGSQYLHRSRNRGDDWTVISPDLTTCDADRTKGNVPHCTITTIAESPLVEGLLWVGTDDGRVWVSRNDGGRWVDLTERFDGLPPRLWVSRVEASAADADTAYVAFTGYREDVRDPFLFRTDDGGESFRSIVNNLPRDAAINVVREHPRNPEVLFAGTELGVQVSVDGGGTWFDLSGKPPAVATAAPGADQAGDAADDEAEAEADTEQQQTEEVAEEVADELEGVERPAATARGQGRRARSGSGGRTGPRVSFERPRRGRLPTVAVHDLVVHPRHDDLVIGTHGRGILILDISAYGALDASILQRPFHAFRPRDGRLTRRAFSSIRYPAAQEWRGDRASARPEFHYYLAQDSDDSVTVAVYDATGRRLFRRRGPTDAGLHQISWSGAARTAGRGRRGGAGRAGVAAGHFVVRFTHGDTTVEYPFVVYAPAGVPGGAATDDGDEHAAGAERGLDLARRVLAALKSLF